MSIGKNSIARAVNATGNVKTQNTTSLSGAVTNFLLDNIGVLTLAKAPEDIESIKKSIEKRGILCPVIVAVTQKGEAWLVDGYRRLSAARELGITQINAIVINVDNKRDANNLYNELYKTKQSVKVVADNIREEKFRVLAVKDHDLPTYLL